MICGAIHRNTLETTWSCAICWNGPSFFFHAWIEKTKTKRERV